MSSKEEIFAELKRQMLRFMGFKKKVLRRDVEEVVIFFDSRSVEKDLHTLRYSLAVPRSVERSNTAFMTMNDQNFLRQNCRKKEFRMENTFNVLQEIAKEAGLYRITSNVSEIHIVIVKKYWFDCCVSFQIFFNVLLAPVQGKEWVSCEDFMRCMEAIHQKNVFRGFFSEKQDKKLSNMMRFQKFLCNVYAVCFCVVEFEYKYMDVECLIVVMELINRMQKTKEQDIINLATSFMERANKRRKEISPYITFQEFKALIFNSAF